MAFSHKTHHSLFLCLLICSLLVAVACKKDDPKPIIEGVASDFFTKSKVIPAGEYVINGVHTVYGDIVVSEGTTFIFTENAGLIVTGSFKAIGTSDKPIIFQGKNNTDGYWGAVVFMSKSTENQLTFCKFMNSGGTNNGYPQAAVVLAGASSSLSYSGKASLRDCQFLGGSNFGFAGTKGAEILAFSRNTFSGYKGAPILVSPDLLDALDGTQKYTNNTNNVVQISGGETSASGFKNTDIKKQPIPYYVAEGGITCNGMITIEAGTEFIMGENTYFTVAGTEPLVAQGTQSAPIVFSGKNHTQGYWGAINLTTNEAHTLQYVQISDAGGFNNSAAQGGLVLANSQASVRNCTFTNNKIAGMQVSDNSEITAFAANIFENNGGYPLSIKASHIASLDGTTTKYGTQNDQNYIEVRGGDMNSTATWRKQTVPYAFTQNSTIQSNEVTILAGAQFAMSEGVFLEIWNNGEYTISGTAQDKIQFFGRNNTPGYWGGIIIASAWPGNIISNATISDGGGFNGNKLEGNIVFIGEGTVTNCNITNSATCGLAIDPFSGAKYTNNTFANNQGGNICK